MNETKPREIELTPELLDYARGVAIHEAQKHCPADCQDITALFALGLVQEAGWRHQTSGRSKA